MWGSVHSDDWCLGVGVTATHIPEQVRSPRNQTLMPGTDIPANPCWPPSLLTPPLQTELSTSFSLVKKNKQKKWMLTWHIIGYPKPQSFIVVQRLLKKTLISHTVALGDSHDHNPGYFTTYTKSTAVKSQLSMKDISIHHRKQCLINAPEKSWL